MKKLKTKIASLAVLALACLGAGAFSLQSGATADAAEIDYARYLTMSNGAAICLKDEFHGIRWTTTVNKNKYLAEAQFGVLVAPTKWLTNTELTHETRNTTKAMDLALKAGAINATDAAVTYYSIIDYDDLSANLGAAYALELTARAYVCFEGEYYYTDISEINTSRSARSVAIASELSGELDEFRNQGEEGEAKAAIAVGYYSAGNENAERYTIPEGLVHDVNTPVMDLSAPFATLRGFEVDGEVDAVVVGATSVDYTYDATSSTLTLRGVPTAVAGECYVSAFTKDGDIYTQPLIVATKVLTEANDLKMFHAKGDAKADSPANKLNRNGEYYYDGYYVLGRNIDASDYVHGSKNNDKSFNNAKWDPYTNYVNKDGSPKTIGLRGTFNGMGYSINGLTIGSQYEGIFGIVNGGTVKNVAFMNVKSDYTDGGHKYVLAHYLIGATIENVHIQTNAYKAASAEKNPGFAMKNSALLAGASFNDSTITNSVLVYSTVNPAEENTTNVSGGLAFAIYDPDSKYTTNNLYCISDNKFTAPIQGGESTKIPHALTFVPFSNEANGRIVRAYNEQKDTTVSGYDYAVSGLDNAPTFISKCLRFNTLAELYANTNYKYSALKATGCWNAEKGKAPAWKKGSSVDVAPVVSNNNLKVLLIGNSHSQDTFWALPQVAFEEGRTDITFGLAKQGGTTLPVHESHFASKAYQYEYYISKDYSEDTTNGAYNTYKQQSMDDILKTKWDYVFLQLGPWDPIVEDIYERSREYIVDYIQEKLPDAKIGYSVSWLSPYHDDVSQLDGLKDLKDQDSYNMYQTSVALANNSKTPYDRYAALVNNVQSSLFYDDGTPKGDHSMVISVGTPVYYASQVLRIPTANLYRDVLHIDQDFGGVLLAYAFYTQFMNSIGQPVDIGDMIDMTTYNQWNGSGSKSTEHTLSDDQRGQIAEAVEYAMYNPWIVPESAPEAPDVPENPGTGDEPSNPGDPTLGTVSTEDLSQYKRILILGNSHSQDTFAVLPDIFKVECANYTEYKFGMLIQSGSSLSEHADNIDTSTKYRYYISNDNYVGYTQQEDITLADAVKDWDIIFFQNGPADLAESGRNMNKTNREEVEKHVLKNNPNIKIGYCVSWVAPYSDAGADGTHYIEEKVATAAKNLPLCYQTSHYASYTTPDWTRFSELVGTDESWRIDYKNPIVQHNKHVNLVRTYLVGDPDKGTARNSTYTAAIGIGTAMIYANQLDSDPVPGGTDKEYATTASGLKKYGTNTLYRDDLHVSDNARALAAYAFYTQYMGVELTSIKMTTIDAGARKQGDTALSISDKWQKLIVRATTYAKNNTWEYVGDNNNGGNETPENPDNVLNGKKIMFIGNSLTHNGQTVLGMSGKSYPTQEVRTGDVGYFHQLCKANGANVTVTNWAYSSHVLSEIFNDATCSDCKTNHMEQLTDRSYDYVVIQSGPSEGNNDATFATDVENIMNLFKAGNPNTKFIVMVPLTAYGVVGPVIETATNTLKHLKTLEQKGVIICDWGGMINDILNKKATVPGATLDYNYYTFTIADQYHPNLLTGYITALMTYCAITKESAVGKTYEFCNNSSLNPNPTKVNYYFHFENFITKYYTKSNGTVVDTNFVDVFASKSDMSGIQQLIDQYLANKSYMNYN